MDIAAIRKKWIDYNDEKICLFLGFLKKEGKLSEDELFVNKKLLEDFSVDYLIDYESELEEDPDNEDFGIITIDTVTAGFLDDYLGRWFIQKGKNPTEEKLLRYIGLFNEFFQFLKDNKLYKERAAQFTKLKKRLEKPDKYLNRHKEYQALMQEKDRNYDAYTDMLQDWEDWDF
ncbi:MAG: hypothetical protein LWY06_10430 [Firmicutes bacterium]|nr:hypothetical protein [Bacillota bacterium]